MKEMSFKSGVEGRGGDSLIGDESKGGDCDEVICADEVNQEDSEQNEVDGIKKGADSTGKVMHM